MTPRAEPNTTKDGAAPLRVLIRYRVKRADLTLELELLRAVYDELESARPEGLRYASFQLEDEVSFVELVETDAPGRFSQLESFRRYRATLDERCDEQPSVTDLRRVGAYGWD